ncbi:hypothetical protein A3709_12740 [Halioglobus sp. HI00S01]|uniref:DUF2855 family protein n=1 Tax=Halioglobus sp. HI00S01 TaxID=1822214 RepID=UPI0007C3B438|nr:DUF2855 family protein [Halioglobus sp. HI00S01]KZX60162.1 hypothetical protein A3709_12740 [Halioglobus sp. HI00S01]
MNERQRLLINRDQLDDVKWHSEALPSPADGQVLLAIDNFALTANNITYAAFGDALQYWAFFPAPAGSGIVPVWGFADVVASNCDGIEVGERFYGFYPLASHLLVEPAQVSDTSFTDNAEHRRSLPVIYNQYLRTSSDALYDADREAVQMLLRPLFTTSFLLDDFFADQAMFGARELHLTSASSKTAIGMAFCLQHNRANRDADYVIVGLTSARNKAFVESLDCYDRVVTYDEAATLGNQTPSAIVDFAGDGTLLRTLHEQLGDSLRYSCLVGASHWDQRAGAGPDMPGPDPVMFFAPHQAEKRISEWGGERFAQHLADQWQAFCDFAGGWMEIDASEGREAIAQTYQQVLAGNFSPRSGYVLSKFSCQ